MVSVQRSLTEIKGVSNTDVSLEKGEAVVTFDGAVTNVEALLKATAGAGYPSAIKKR